MKPHFTALQRTEKRWWDSQIRGKTSIQDPQGPFLCFDRKIVLFKKVVKKKKKKTQTSKYTQCKTPAHKTVFSISLYSSFVKQKLTFSFPGSFVKANDNASLSIQSLVGIYVSELCLQTFYYTHFPMLYPKRSNLLFYLKKQESKKKAKLQICTICKYVQYIFFLSFFKLIN